MLRLVVDSRISLIEPGDSNRQRQDFEIFDEWAARAGQWRNSANEHVHF